MRVLSLEVHNVQHISDVRFDLDGHNLFIVGGKNAAGKSSALIALLMALSGRSGMDNYPEIALKQGEDEGWVKVELSGESELTHQPGGMTVNLKLVRHPRKGTVVEEFSICDSDGEPAPAPRELLKRLYNLRAFDPLEFSRMKPKEQKVLLEQLLGLDFTEARAEYARLYEQRTAINRETVRAKSLYEGLPKHPDCEEVSISDLMEEADRRRGVNESNSSERRKLSDATAKLAAENSRIDRYDADIAELMQRIQVLKDRRALATATADEYSKSVEEQRRVVAALVDENVSEISERINNADLNNRMARENAKRAEAKQRWMDLSQQSEDITETMKSIEAENKKKLAEAKFPIDGMSMDSDGILLHGLPFSQASTKQRIAASVAVGIALNPTLRLMVSQDGGALDDDAIQELDRTLADSDFQMIVEIALRTPADDDLCSVIIRDGKVSKTNGKRKTPVLFDEPAA